MPQGESGAARAPASSIVGVASAILDEESKRRDKWTHAWPGESAAASVSSALDAFGAARAWLGAAAGSGDAALLPEAHGAAGSSVHVNVTLANDRPTPVTVTFRWTDLVSSRGDRLSEGAVTLSPSEAEIPGHGVQVFRIEVEIPADARTGEYEGLLVSTGDDVVRAVMSVRVDRRCDRDSTVGSSGGAHLPQEPGS